MPDGYHYNRILRLAVVPTKTPHDFKGSSSEVLVVVAVIPGGGLVVAGTRPETAVQVADEAVGEGA